MNNLKSILIIAIAVLCIPLFLKSQSVGIGTPTPNGFSMLDISSSNKGLLIPRMALSSTTSNSPVGAFVAGMMVYNTATVGDVTPGFYLCNGTKWEKAGSGWSLTGNSGTSPTTNFIGTTDDQDLVFKRNNERVGLINNSTNQTSFGVNALNPSNTGINNTAIGKSAMAAPGISNENTAVGYGALQANSTGSSNVAIGSIAMYGNTIGNNNVGIGFNAMDNNKAGNSSIAIGSYAMKNANNTTTPFLNTNIAIGAGSMHGSATPANNTGIGNNVIGLEALHEFTSGSRNNVLGTQSLYNNTTGSGNIAIGYRSLYNNTIKSDNTAVGDSALYNNGTGAVFLEDASFNTAIGAKAMQSNTTGFHGTAVGYKALMKNTTGRFNTAMGHGAMQNLATHSSANSAFGQGALFFQTGGDGGNTGIGAGALNSIITGGYNTGLGYRAGFENEGQKNIFIGSEAGYYEAGSNKLYIENSNADSTNALIFGNFASNKLRVNGKTESVYNVIANDDPAIYGENDNTDYYGIGVQGRGGWIGVDGITSGTGIDTYFGSKGTSNGTNTGSNYGVRGDAFNGSKNFGIYGSTASGSNNYAGYFEGDVAIGGSTPKKAAGYRLSVDGKIAAEEILVDLDGDWPDYVFKQDYNLKSLADVKAFIEKNGHLPNVPSAKDVEDNGILLGNMNKILMEKIEELTLYILKQEEMLKNYESRIEKLEKR